jgi:hypothetical protein
VYLWAFVSAAALLSLERICYLWIWRNPGWFSAVCARLLPARIGEPVAALKYLFYGFKFLQGAVFIAWCHVHGNGSLFALGGNLLATGVGAALIVAGQTLNAGVFYRLGTTGVFYGNKFGYDVPWCRGFPFSLFAHPQYAGALLSIWGFFLIMRFPRDDWLVLPMVETIYYAAGAYLERERSKRSNRSSRSNPLLHTPPRPGCVAMQSEPFDKLRANG